MREEGTEPLHVSEDQLVRPAVEDDLSVRVELHAAGIEQDDTQRRNGEDEAQAGERHSPGRRACWVELDVDRTVQGTVSGERISV
jgi:hypothetical protein